MQTLFLVVFSPTRLLVEWFLNRTHTAGERGNVLRVASWSFFTIEVLLLAWLSARGPLALGPLPWITWPLLYYALIRTFEIVIAFFFDAHDKLDGKPRRSDLRPTERVQMVIKSYFGLIVFFALAYHTLPAEFKQPLSGWQAIYFSGVTITTLGYGDISPTKWLGQALVLVEVLLGLFLLVVSIASYLNLPTNAENQES